MEFVATFVNTATHSQERKLIFAESFEEGCKEAFLQAKEKGLVCDLVEYYAVWKHGNQFDDQRGE